MKRKFWIKLIYGLVDIILAFTFGVFTFRYSGVPGFSYYSEVQFNSIFIYAGALALAHVIAFFVFKVYSILSTNFSVIDVIRVSSISGAVSLLGLVFIVAIPNKYLFFQWQELFSWIVATIMLMVLLSTARFLTRLYSMLKKKLGGHKTVRTLVIGAGSAAKVVVDDAKYNKDNIHDVVVLVDDDPNKIGGRFSNIPVKGPISEINKVIEFFDVEEVIIAIADLSEERLHDILNLLSTSNVSVKRLPLLSEMQGPNDVRIINVDIDDLLSRDPIILDNKEVNNMLKGKTVLITGAGGSIGSELTRQIFNTHPKNLVLLDIYENSLYDIQMELVRKMREESIKDINLVVLIGSTYNDVRMEQIFKEYQPDYIYHAAAYKHVPLMEDSPAEAIRTNVVGTYNIAKLADKYHAQKMVLVSTDKAVRPTNVMGATKRFAETIIQYYADHSKTKYAAVRFGNVLGSNGSVVPLFKKQIELGGPVTITDKEITRYFMTIPEAVSLILQCGLFAEGGEIFILDMGQPVKIYHLAERLIRQAGYTPNKEIKIIEVGLRPGEKMYEELLLNKEEQTPTKNKKIFIEPTEMVNEKVLNDIEKASVAFGLEESKRDVKELLESLISTYTITENNGKK